MCDGPEYEVKNGIKLLENVLIQRIWRVRYIESSGNCSDVAGTARSVGDARFKATAADTIPSILPSMTSLRKENIILF